jgi:hypothetical protein
MTTRQFSETDMWSELDQYFKIEVREPGDVTVNDVAKHYAVSDETARVWMNQLVNDGKYRRVTILENGSRMKVFRKAQAGA